MTPAFNVLFLCTHNSARSIMAEAILERIGKGKFHAYSAGSRARARRRCPRSSTGCGCSATTSRGCARKSWNEFTGPDAPRMDFVITLCDTLDGQVCPDFGERPVTAAWPFPDPAKFTGSPAERTTLLNELYGMIRRRLDVFTSLPFASLDRMALKARLDELGDSSKVSCMAAARMRVGINGMGRIGRLALRAALGGFRRAGWRSARRQPPRHRPRQRDQGRGRRRPRICSNSTASTAAGMPDRSRSRRQAHRRRRQAHRLHVGRTRRATSPGAISAATSCSNAPASS